MACQERARGRLHDQRCFCMLAVEYQNIKKNTGGQGGAVTAQLPTGTTCTPWNTKLPTATLPNTAFANCQGVRPLSHEVKG